MMTLEPPQLTHVVTSEYAGTLYGLAHDALSEQLYVGGSDGAVYALDPRVEKPELRKTGTAHDNYVSCLAISRGVLVSGGYDRRLVWTDLESGRRLAEVVAHEGWVRDVGFLPDGERLASVGDDMRVRIWDRQGQLLRSCEGHAQRTPEGYATALYALAISPDGRVLASGDRTGQVRLWDALTGELLQSISAPTFYTYDPEKRVRSIGGIRCLRFSPQGDRLAIGGIGKVTNVDGFVGPCRVELWDWRAGERTFEGQDKHQAVLNALTFAPDGEWLLGAGGGDGGGVLAFWDQKQASAVHLAKPKGHVHRLHLDAARGQLACAGFGGVQFWKFKAADA